MQLELTKPILFFDLETTGLKIGVDRIVEISLIKVHPDGNIEKYTQRVNPGMPIPAASTAIHKITDEDVKDEPLFEEIALKVKDFIKDGDFGGYNSNYYDIPVLLEEFLRVNVDFELKGRRTVDVQSIFHQNEPRDLKAAYRFYCNKSLEGHHSAEADAMATYEILLAQLDKYENIKNDITFLHKYTARSNRFADLAGRIAYNDKDVEVFNFGKYKGVPVKDVFAKDLGYYKWMMDGEFPMYTKRIITSIRLKMRED